MKSMHVAVSMVCTVLLVASQRVHATDEVEDPAYATAGQHLSELAAHGLIGAASPAVSLTTIDGQTIDLGALYGKKPVYLKFWATWCVPCRQQMPGFEKIYETVGDRVQVIAVDIGFNDDAAAVRNFRQKAGLRMPVVIDDGSLGGLFNLRVTPQHVLIGRDGRIEYLSHVADTQLDAAIQKLINEPVRHAEVKHRAPMSARALQPGESVHGLSATTSHHVTVELSDTKGKSVRAVLFFSTWCESYLADSRPDTSRACREVREKIDRLAAQDDVSWIGVAGGPWSTPADLTDYLSNTRFKIPVALDLSGKLFRAFGVRNIPALAVIGEDGTLLHVLQPDELGANEKELLQKIRAIAHAPQRVSSIN